MNVLFRIKNNPDLKGIDVTAIYDMSYLFSINTTVDNTTFNGDISEWDVSNATNMQFMFVEATAFNADIGNWNVSNVTNISSMFKGATAFNQNLANWSAGWTTAPSMTDAFTSSGSTKPATWP